MIIFFLSCELVEFYYHLFLRTLPACSGAPASRQPPSASTRFKFLRLHGNMEQEVSFAPVPGSGSGPESDDCERGLLGSALASASDSAGQGGDESRAGGRPTGPGDRSHGRVGAGKGVFCSRVFLLRELPSST